MKNILGHWDIMMYIDVWQDFQSENLFIFIFSGSHQGLCAFCGLWEKNSQNVKCP